MTQRGSALIYILIAIALLAALTMAFVEPSSQQGRAQNSYKIATSLKAQAELIRSAVQDCILTYPAGDPSVTDVGYNAPYPVTPSSTYLPVGLRDSAEKAKSILCPGNPGNSSSHSAIFGSTTGRYLQPAPALLNDWTYGNNSNGVYIVISTNKSDAYLTEGMQKAAAGYDVCETDYITNGTAPCTSGYYCWRVWIKRNTSCP